MIKFQRLNFILLANFFFYLPNSAAQFSDPSSAATNFNKKGQYADVYKENSVEKKALSNIKYKPMNNKLLSADRLLLVRSITKNRKTMVIQIGRNEGIFEGMELLFTSDDYSIVAVATEVNRHYSMWITKRNNATFPFNKRETLIASAAKENIWDQIPTLAYEKRFFKEDIKFNSDYRFLVRFSMSSALYESTSEVDSDREPSRGGVQLSGLVYNHFHPSFEVGFGLRYDLEKTVFENPNLEVPTVRIFALAEFIYHFENFSGSDSNLFIAMTGGIGRSQTTVNDATSSGRTILAPGLRLGYIVPTNLNAWVYDIVVESISSKESFVDSEEQTTNIVNAKASIGYRF